MFSMKSSPSIHPPVSPVLLAGIALRPLPLVLLQPLLDAAMAIMNRRYPDLFARLTGLAGGSFLIDPIDLPFAFLLRPAPPPRLIAIDQTGAEQAVTATIQGPLVKLIHLLEGKLDGDALFFSRDLVVEGNMEAVVTLRNAVDGAGINVFGDLISVLGPLARPAELVHRRATNLIARMDQDLAVLKQALLAPIDDRYQAQALELEELQTEVTALRRQRRPGHTVGRAARATQDQVMATPVGTPVGTPVETPGK